MKRTLFVLLITFITICGLVATSLVAQGITGSAGDHAGFMNYPHSSLRVTIQRNTDFQTTLKILEGLALQHERRNIINLSSFQGGIPVQINNIYWKDALDLLIVQLGLVLEERPGVYIVSDVVHEVTIESEYNVDDRMVRIHATFFYADRNFMNGMGIDWGTLIDGEVSADVTFGTATDTENIFQISGTRQLVGGTTIFNLEALLRFMESHQKGTMLARPSVTALNGRAANIQIGQDFSLRTLDEAGNTVNEFFSTGIILSVTPTIIAADGIEAVYLQAALEKSEAIPGAVTTVVNRNQTQTDVLLFNGEETVIGGLFDVEHVTYIRRMPILGRIPILKYLFSSRNTRDIHREMIVIVKAEIIPPARERLHERERLRDSFQRMRLDFEDVREEVFGR